MSLLQIGLLYLLSVLVVAYSLGRYHIIDVEKAESAFLILKLSYLWPMYILISILSTVVFVTAIVGHRAGRKNLP